MRKLPGGAAAVAVVQDIVGIRLMMVLRLLMLFLLILVPVGWLVDLTACHLFFQNRAEIAHLLVVLADLVAVVLRERPALLSCIVRQLHLLLVLMMSITRSARILITLRPDHLLIGSVPAHTIVIRRLAATHTLFITFGVLRLLITLLLRC